MKNKNWIAYITIFDMISTKETHYWVSFYPPSDNSPKAKRFSTYADAEKYALKYAHPQHVHGK
jgi:hypothetical protein